MSRPLTRRSAVVVAVLLGALALPFLTGTGVAHACACGAYSPARGGAATVSHETALVRLPGDGTEDVYLSLTLDSDVRTGALLFPVPDRHAVVSAGPAGLFDELERISAVRPTAVTDRGAPGNAAGAVRVESRQAIGPLDVVTLTADDAAALGGWLRTNGFAAKPALTATAGPYVSAGWAFVAVRLRPSAAGAAALHGRLDPLRIRFRSEEPVYPMRLSRGAAEPAGVTVYTAARHRQDLHTGDAGMSVTWAGRLGPASAPALAEVTRGGTDYLTRWDGTLAPAGITDDFHFVRAADDAIAPTTGARELAARTMADPPFASGRRGSDVAAMIGLSLAAATLLVGAGLLAGRRRGR